MSVEVLLTRTTSVAAVIERVLASSERTVDAALYRLNNPRLARALGETVQRGVKVRVVLDRGKYEETPATRKLGTEHRIPFRLAYGREGPGSKMHHKFALIDGHTALTGSFNWTLESEEQNYESLMIVREPAALAAFRREFEALWAESTAPTP